jgi:hypothetical protein
MNRVRIVSDGMGTAEITDAETGAHIPGVTRVTIEMRPGQPNIVRIETQCAALDVVADAETEEATDGLHR